MINCPACGGVYHILTSRPVSSEVREYCCRCKECDARFRQYAVFEAFIVENKNSRPPNPQQQPVITQSREILLSLLNPQKEEEPDDWDKPIGMVFKQAR